MSGSECGDDAAAAVVAVEALWSTWRSVTSEYANKVIRSRYGCRPVGAKGISRRVGEWIFDRDVINLYRGSDSLAGLSSAVIGLTEQIDTPVLKLFVLLAGNVFVMVLERLVVFVQTTRLVLFEFFIRFLRAEDRVFMPFRSATQARRPKAKTG